jgi:hypothetical protein
LKGTDLSSNALLSGACGLEAFAAANESKMQASNAANC